MSNSQLIPPPSIDTYTPGGSKPKFIMILLGIGLFIAGFCQIWHPVEMVLFGKKVRAEVVAVVKTKEGLPDVALTDPAQLEAQLEPNDRSYIFWNLFQFRTETGHSVEVRAPVGSVAKPLYPLIDADGLPSADLIYYDQNAPEVVTFPLIASTWFEPGALMVIGAFCAAIGSVLLYWAKTPICLPKLPSTRRENDIESP